jgi:glyoxylase-like metal-dependent hydrolase (beta-lactamase superfamily II)
VNQFVLEVTLIAADNPGPLTGEGNNTYLLLGQGGDAALVDAGVGAPSHLARLEQHLGERRATLRRVLVTHAHADHASGAPILAAAHPGALFFKHPWPDEDARLGVAWHAIGDGDRFGVAGHDMVILHTPGHSPDHVVLWDADSGTLFTGDLVSERGSVMIPASRGGRLAPYLQTLERLLALEPKRLLPAHGRAIDDPGAVLRGHLAHRRMRERQVLAALARGPNTVQGLAESIYDGLAAALVPAACENVRAHLDKLEDDGLVDEEGGVWSRHA